MAGFGVCMVDEVDVLSERYFSADFREDVLFEVLDFQGYSYVK